MCKSAEDRSSRYVAEENIEVIKPQRPKESMLWLSGRYFKRFDDTRGVFVSNIEDEYPDG